MAATTKTYLQAMAISRAAMTVTFGASLAYIMWTCAPISVPQDPSLIDRQVFTLRWLALSLTPILFGVRLVGNVRYEYMDTAGVMTTSPYAEELVRLKQRALQNTLEQTALHVPIMLILSTYLDSSNLKLVPIIVVLFVIGRILFFIGYLATGDHSNRAFGFILTIFSNTIPLAYCLYRLVIGFTFIASYIYILGEILGILQKTRLN